MTPVFRFAPSPNGRLHLGHACSALLNARLAEKMHGRFLVRIEDIDTARCTLELTEECLDDLAWLGLEWETPVRVQSRHFADYARALTALEQRGLLYPCFCTRSEIALASNARDPDGAPLYSGACAALSAHEAQARIAQGIPHAKRLRMEAARLMAGPLSVTRFLPRFETFPAFPERWGDVILARKETPASYHLAVTVDGALQGVTHVVRGKDLEAATGVHALLQTLLGFPRPLYHHHALLTDETGEKLAKSRASETLAGLRARGVTAGEIHAMLEDFLIID